MNTHPPRTTSLFATLAGILGSFLIIAGLVWVMQRYTRPAPVDQARIDERKKARAETEQAAADALSTYGWVDEGKGIVRLKIDQAMELVLQEYKNPAAFRTNLMARVEKANAVPPPPANPFE
jgi:hypothetical protein